MATAIGFLGKQIPSWCLARRIFTVGIIQDPGKGEEAREQREGKVKLWHWAHQPPGLSGADPASQYRPTLLPSIECDLGLGVSLFHFYRKLDSTYNILQRKGHT